MVSVNEKRIIIITIIIRRITIIILIIIITIIIIIINRGTYRARSKSLFLIFLLAVFTDDNDESSIG